MKPKKKAEITKSLLKKLGIEMLEDTKGKILKDKKLSIDKNKFLGKLVVTKSGKRFGEVGDILNKAYLVINHPTAFCEGIELEKNKSGKSLIPYDAIEKIGDFIVVKDEGDLI